MGDILSAREAFDLSTIDRNEEVQAELEKTMCQIAKATQKGAYEIRVYHLREENQKKLQDLGFTITKKTPASKSFSYYEIEWEKPDDPFFDGDDEENPPEEGDKPTNPDNPGGDDKNPTNPDDGKDPTNPDDGTGTEKPPTGDDGDDTANKDDIDNLFPEGDGSGENTPTQPETPPTEGGDNQEGNSQS